MLRLSNRPSLVEKKNTLFFGFVRGLLLGTAVFVVISLILGMVLFYLNHKF